MAYPFNLKDHPQISVDLLIDILSTLQSIHISYVREKYGDEAFAKLQEFDKLTAQLKAKLIQSLYETFGVTPDVS